MRAFCSIYASLFADFIAFKRNLGYKYVGAEYTYHQLDELIEKRQETSIGISKDLSTAWSIQRPNETENTKYRRVMYLIHFSAYLQKLGYTSYIPVLPSSYKSTFIPYIFTKREMESIFDVCDHMHLTNQMNSHLYVMPCLLRLLYGTGIRVGEAVALRKKDVNFQDNTLLVHNSKNGKQRRIPMADSLAKVCKQYQSSSYHFVSSSDQLFFVKRNGDPCSAGTIYEWFRKILYKARIPHGGKGMGPRLHDVRHTFSVHSLESMAKRNLDLYYSLPILSEYLGHQSLEATEKYVRLTAEMYPDLLQDVSHVGLCVYPEREYHEAN